MKQITISSLACSGEGGVEAALERAKAMTREACCDHTDLICFPEIFAWTCLDIEQKRKAAEPVGGKVCSFMAKLASEHSVNILTPLLERQNDRLYNSMVWFDRRGKVLGTYHKVFPTVYEMDEGVYPGPLEFDVFRSEFGPIGCCICFDLNFPEVIERIAKQSARLIIFPTMFDGVSLMRAWSKLRRMYFLSVAGDPYSTLVNPLGEVLIEGWRHPAIMTATVNLDYAVLHQDENRDKFAAAKKKYGALVEIESRPIESCALLVSRHPEKTAEEIVSECGLELEADYYGRTAQFAKRRRAAHSAVPLHNKVKQGR